MGDDLYRRVDACRVCGSDRLTTVLDLGTPFISDFLPPGDTGDRAPLVMARCEDCTLVQTRHVVAEDRLFRTYWYRSGTNESMRAALADVVEDARSRVALKPDDAVLDIGANDGTLLACYPDHICKHGYEPALALAAEGDYDHRGRFFPGPVVRLSHWLGRYKVITSVAMLYAVNHPHGFVDAIKFLLAQDGVWVVQLQDLASVLRDRAFDYFCHEHLCLYSLHSFERLIHEHGLEIRDWSTNAVNGGSLRIIVGHGCQLKTSVRPEDEPEAWASFGRDVEARKTETVALLKRMRDTGQQVIGYGASTKGNTLLQYYGIGPELLPCIAERSPQKWGRVTVGSGIPIVSEEEARAMHPACFFVLPWGFAEAFAKREDVPLILPLPHLELRAKAKVAA